MSKIKHIFFYTATALLLLMVVGSGACKKYIEYSDVILITGTETERMVKFTVEDIPSSFAVTATATAKVENDIQVNFEVDSTLVSTYNEEMSANYHMLPEGSYELSGNSGVIRAGTNISSPITVRIISFDDFVDGRPYVLPVTIRSAEGNLPVLEASRTIFLRIARVIDFTALDISNPSFYYPYAFNEPYNNVTRYTFEIKCYINEWHPGNPPISRLCNWGPVDESMPNLLRFGEAGSKINQLQWVSAEGSVFSTTEFATQTWYTISCVYDGTTYRMYVDGRLDASFEGAGKVYQLGALELGMSYAGYQNSQRFLGRIAEVRFWDRSLSITEIQEGLCGVDAASSGLVAYWKLNEGEGNVFYDRTGNGRDMYWPRTAVWNSDVTNKCAQ